MNSEAFEAWRETQPWYIVTRNQDEDGAIHRLANMAAQSAWDAASAQVPADRDAVRYRWLRDHASPEWLATGPITDATVDAALAALRQALGGQT